MDETDDHIGENRRYWNERAARYAKNGREQWASDPSWGCWGLSNESLPLLPDDMSGLDAIELGCGTAYGSAWMARRGAQVTGVDLSAAQLATAQALNLERGLNIELLDRDAESTGLRAGSFDFALSEYGACLWCEPSRWLAETARLLRSGGELRFLTTHPMAQVCSPMDGSLPATERLERPWFGSERYDWRDADDEPGGIEFVPTLDSWFRHARAAGFRVENYRELRAPGSDRAGSSHITAAWGHRWPAEHAFWLVRE